MDWADEAAKEFLNELDWDDCDIIEGPGNPYDELATALRKAKADGMREAADWIVKVRPDKATHTYTECEAVLAVCEVSAEAFRARANAIEKGTG